MILRSALTSGLLVDAEHARDRVAVDVAVERAGRVALGGQRRGQVGGHRRLADAALAGGDADHVLDLGERALGELARGRASAGGPASRRRRGRRSRPRRWSRPRARRRSGRPPAGSGSGSGSRAWSARRRPRRGRRRGSRSSAPCPARRSSGAARGRSRLEGPRSPVLRSVEPSGASSQNASPGPRLGSVAAGPVVGSTLTPPAEGARWGAFDEAGRCLSADAGGAVAQLGHKPTRTKLRRLPARQKTQRAVRPAVSGRRGGEPKLSAPGLPARYVRADLSGCFLSWVAVVPRPGIRAKWS